MAEKAIWTEKVSRRAVQALISQFSSVADAVLELVDNAIDRAENQILEVNITFDKRAERIVVESDGGSGMGAHEIAAWLVWGGDNHINPDDIGFYGQGGKAAAGFLAKDIRIWAKRRGDSDIWMFEDEDWASRTEIRDFGHPAPVDEDEAPLSVQAAKRSRGHVRIELNHAYMNRRWNFGVLKRHIASTYGKLLGTNKLKILVNGEVLSPIPLPIDSSVDKYQIDVMVGDISVKGWAGKLMRASVGDYTIKSGFRLFAKGRLIREGEWFGYNWQSKGALNLLIGELEITGLTLNLDKSDFRERADEVWHEISTEVVTAIAKLIGTLRSSHDAKISKSEKKRAEMVKAEIAMVLRELYGAPSKPHAGGSGKTRGSNKSARGKAKHAPSIKRLLEGRYDIEIGAWEPHIRAAVQGEAIIVNKAFPAWNQFEGSKAYIAETVLDEVVRADPDVISITEFCEKRDALLHRWAESQVA